MPLQRQVISWPLTGGLDTKTSPLMVQPGSHITLDNVRQERTNEWRARNGTSRSALDDLPQSLPPVMVGTAGLGGGLVALTATPAVAATTKSAFATYAAALTTARWQRLNSSTTAPGARLASAMVIERRTLFPVLVTADSFVHASNGNTSFSSCFSATLLAGLADGIAIGDGVASQGVQSTSSRRRVVFGATYYLLIRTTPGSANVTVERYSEAGAQIGSTTTIGTDGYTATNDQYVDAIKYPGATTTTIVYRTNAGGFRFVEYNDTTDTVATTVAIAQACENCLALLPDPDSSGVRFVAVSSATPDVRVLRMTSAGAVTTNEAVDTVAATQIAGCAYAAGASYQVVYQTATDIRMNKKRSGVVGTFSPLVSADARFTLHSNAWRETSDDQMRLVYGFHGPAGDVQDTYFIAAFPFDNGSGNEISLFCAQAKMLPLDAGPALTLNATLPQCVRIATRSVEIPLLRLTNSGFSGTQSASRYNVDVFRVTDMSTSAPATYNVGVPKTLVKSALVPAGLLMEVSAGKNISPHGLNIIPPKPVLTPSTGAGALTLGAVYQYCNVLIAKNDNGEEWRSPPSIPATITLTGTQNTVQVDSSLPVVADDQSRTVTIEWYRTKANGSVFQRYRTTTNYLNLLAGAQASDVASDQTLGSGQFLYTGAELASILTPPFSHVEPHGGRVWGIHRDYRNTLFPSKMLANGKSPEWAAELALSIVDEEGDLTNIASMDDKLIAFKGSAVYVVTGDGPNNAGVGGSFTITKVDSDVGAIAGSPVISTGSEVFFVSARGIYMIDRSLQVSFVGAPVDQFLNQPLVQTKETIVVGVFSAAANEVRFQTTNYRLVYDRLRGLWYRDTGAGMQNVVATCMVGTKQALFKSDGTMWIEGDSTVALDNGATYTSRIRSAWIRPAGYDGRLRLYMARALMFRTNDAGGGYTPVLNIYYDNDDAIVESYSPNPAIPNGQAITRASAQPRRHRCSTFSLETVLQTGGNAVRLDAWGAEVGLRPGAFRNASGANSERWV